MNAAAGRLFNWMGWVTGASDQHDTTVSDDARQQPSREHQIAGAAAIPGQQLRYTAEDLNHINYQLRISAREEDSARTIAAVRELSEVRRVGGSRVQSRVGGLGEPLVETSAVASPVDRST